MPLIDGPDTRTLRSSRSSSPAGQQLEPTEPLNPQELSLVATMARETLTGMQGDNPSAHVMATFRRKDDVSGKRQTLYGKLRKEGLKLWGVWEDKPSKEYEFPHPDLDYFEVNLVEQRKLSRRRPLSAQEAQDVNEPPTQELHEELGARPICPTSQLSSDPNAQIPEGVDPNALDPYEPITFGPWINYFDDGGFRTRDLMRELRDAPEYGLRVNQYYQDRGFVIRQERFFNNVFCKWILFARMIPNWNEGPYLEMGRAIIQTLRDAYWQARQVDVELVHQKLQKEVRPNDKFYHHVNEQLVERQKQHSRAVAHSSAHVYSTAHYGQAQPRPSNFSQRKLLCFGCQSPEHLWRNCPKRFQQGFRARVAGPASSSKSL